jgi:hypothetical protein
MTAITANRNGRLIIKRRLKFKVLALLAAVPALLIVYLSQKYMYDVDPVLRVVNLMGTLIHEGGHSLLTLLTGGYLAEMVIKPDGSGYAMIGGGATFLSLPAGYLSTTLLTALMFLINNRTRWGEVIPLILGIAYAYLTFAFGAKLAGGSTTIIVGYVCSALLIYFGMHPNIPIFRTGKHISVHDVVWMFWVNLISLYYGLGGILSLQYLTRYAEHGNPDDVSVFTDTFFPSMHPTTMASIWMWGSILVWVVVFIVIIRYFLKKKEETEL